MRKRIAVAALLALSFLRCNESHQSPDSAPASKASAVAPCEQWSLNGYRVGMTREQVTAVRKVTMNGEFLILVHDEQASFSGAAAIEDGHLTMWTANYADADPGSVKRALIEQFGPPVDKGASDTIHRGEDGRPYLEASSSWTSEECDSTVVLLIHAFADKGGGTESIASLASVSLFAHDMELKAKRDLERARSVIK